MAKLYFRYGTVGSAKTMNLLAVAHNYRHQNKRVLLIKPAMEDRFGVDLIRSRAGLQMEADLLLGEGDELDMDKISRNQCILVDEAQFLTVTQIDALKDVASYLDIPVICYGLRTDFRRQLFPGSRRLFEISDSLEEVKTTCAFCNRKAIFNLKFRDGVPTSRGPVVDLGADEKYQPACAVCYKARLEGGELLQRTRSDHSDGSLSSSMTKDAPVETDSSR